ncbi:MAG: hypothetical protein MHM6MM_000760 [Cercozoa sp. M6MM]
MLSFLIYLGTATDLGRCSLELIDDIGGADLLVRVDACMRDLDGVFDEQLQQHAVLGLPTDKVLTNVVGINDDLFYKTTLTCDDGEIDRTRCGVVRAVCEPFREWDLPRGCLRKCSEKLFPLPRKITCQDDYAGMLEGSGAVVAFKKDVKFVFRNGQNQLIEKARKRMLDLMFDDDADDDNVELESGATLINEIVVHMGSLNSELTANVNERYSIVVRGDSELVMKCEATFGCVHAFMTLSQMTGDDNVGYAYVRNGPWHIEDWPRFPHRGFMFDTSRHYFDVSLILRNIDALAWTRMNVLHWHITDSQTFPLVIPGVEHLALNSSYPKEKRSESSHAKLALYTLDDVKRVIQYGYERGVRVLPEIDTPGHSYSWGLGKPGITVCGNQQPWWDYCAGPPCGQLDPTSDVMWNTLETVLTELTAAFGDDYFHAGFDEVNFRCWDTAPHIKDYMRDKGMTDYHELYQEFTDRQHEFLRGRNKRVMVWEEPFAEDIALGKDVVVQVWRSHDILRDIVRAGHEAVYSNADAMYLDCGQSSYVNGQKSWCDPYKSWQTIYSHEPVPERLGLSPEEEKRVLGGETCMWTGQTDRSNVMSKVAATRCFSIIWYRAQVWPRTAAWGERAWAPRTLDDWSHAQSRLLEHRERLFHRGVDATPMQPGWCFLRKDGCSNPDGGNPPV